MKPSDLVMVSMSDGLMDDFKRKTLAQFDNPVAFYKGVCAVHLALPAKVEEAVKRLQNSPFNEAQFYVGHSGGKDSVLVRWLADLAGFEGAMTVHTPKPNGVRNAVHPLTKEFVYALSRPVLYIPEASKELFRSLNLTVQIDGTRRAEADRRDGRDVGLIVNGEEKSRTEVPLYLETGLFDQSFIYPIYDWSDEMVWAAIWAYDIPYSAEYNELQG